MRPGREGVGFHKSGEKEKRSSNPALTCLRGRGKRLGKSQFARDCGTQMLCGAPGMGMGLSWSMRWGALPRSFVSFRVLLKSCWR